MLQFDAINTVIYKVAMKLRKL